MKGQPRGLIWVGYSAFGEPMFGSDWALVPIQLDIAAVPDGPLADVPQANESRPVVAVFRWVSGRWSTDGRTVFNLGIAAVAERIERGA